jgi:Tfp pilus assembly protein PilN
MAQNVNLYAKKQKPRAGVFSAPGLLAIVAALAAGGAALYAIEVRRIEQMRAQVLQAGVDAERLQRRLAEVPNPSAELAAQVTAEEREVVALEAIAAKLSAGALGRAGGFTSHLRALGRTTTQGVWLTAIRLDNAAGSVSLEGRALESARVPVYIDGLRRDPLFAGTIFAAIEIKAIDDRTATSSSAPLMQFRLQGADTRVKAGSAVAPTVAMTASGNVR